MVDTSREHVVSNMIWKLLEQFGAQGVTFIVSIVLARILEPSVYGTIALVTVFTTILGVFIDSGFGSALVQKKEADDLDFSSVFFFNIFMCSAIYIGLFFLAPLISQFYNIPTLTPIIRVLSLSLVISGVKNIQGAYVSRNMLFKKFFFSTLGGTIGAAVIGIILAIKGYGVWALVAQYLFNNLVDTIILWITVPWRPKACFSISRLKILFAFGEILNAEDKNMLLVPRGLAHGFIVLSDYAEFTYKCDDYYHPEDEGGIIWNDPDIGIEWPLNMVDEIILSEMDKIHPTLAECKMKFRIKKSLE